VDVFVNVPVQQCYCFAQVHQRLYLGYFGPQQAGQDRTAMLLTRHRQVTEKGLRFARFEVGKRYAILPDVELTQESQM
jgi:hypothetical protein